MIVAPSEETMPAAVGLGMPMFKIIEQPIRSKHQEMKDKQIK
jgi:hypothetical protein